MATRLVKVGHHKVSLSELYSRLVNKISKPQFARIIKNIERDLNKELKV